MCFRNYSEHEMYLKFIKSQEEGQGVEKPFRQSFNHVNSMSKIWFDLKTYDGLFVTF